MAEEHIYDTVGKRLKRILSDMGLTIEQFAKPINMDRGQLGKVLNDNMGITTKQVLDISSHYGVRAGWILEAELPVYKKEKSGPVVPDRIVNGLDKESKAIQVSLDKIQKVVLELSGLRKDTDRPSGLGFSGKRRDYKNQPQKNEP